MVSANTELWRHGLGDNEYGQTQVPSGLNNVIVIAAGSAHSVALRADGTVAAWGYNANGQCNVPASLQNVTGIAAGMFHTVALRSNGTVAAWGYNGRGQTDVPVNLPKATAVAAGGFFNLALTANGSVVGWGDNGSGQITPPAGLTNVVAIAAGMDHGMALRQSGTVVAWGDNSFGQTSVPYGLTNVIAIAAGSGHSLAARQDGTVVAWGFDDAGQIDVPAGLSNVIAVTAGYEDSLALKQDGTVVGWGRNDYGQVTIPAGVQKAIAIAAGDLHGLALVPGVAGIAVTVQPDPPSCSFTVDGVAFSGAQLFSWLPGSSHVLGAPAQQTVGPGTQCYWQAWSDGGTITHTVMPSTATNYAVSFTSQHYLTMESGVGGQVSPVSCWTNAGVLVGIKATPGVGYRFGIWTGSGLGSYSGTNPDAAVTMNGPVTETATFVDNVKPTNTVTAPTSGQLWSNALFTAKGQVSDNSGTSGVYYQVNGGGWSPAPQSAGTWQIDFPLIPGTNYFRAYAVDADGNYSATNSVTFRYVADALRVAMTGKGTLSPNYSNSVLVFGQGYSITATPAKGFGFSNWTIATNWLGDRVATNATVQFTMVPELTLQAAFVDVARPTNILTAPTGGQRWSYVAFTVTGTARDNVQVTNVFYQLNGAGWNEATSVNGWSNWTANVTLVPGTNTIKACALDSAKNKSATNSAAFQFVVTNLVGVRATGLGILSPNYSNSWLEIGRNYSMTATPSANGFAFANWTTSTNWVSGAVSTNRAILFMMTPGLTLEASFLDTDKPKLTVKAPIAGKKMTNALVNLVGTASDNWQVTGVWYQLNNGQWLPVNSANSYSNWTATGALLAGTNTLKAYAVDRGRNFSLTNSLSIVSSNTFKLQFALTDAVPLKTNGLVFSLDLSTGLNGRIQVSTNLTLWSMLTDFFGTNSTLTFRDPAATNSPRRFYRAVIP